MMFPTRTLTPDLSCLDPKIAPLVHEINLLGIPTYYSCEGHGNGHKLVQSAFPMVVVSPDRTPDGAMAMLRLMTTVGLHNDDCHSTSDIKWGLFLRDRAYTLMPMDRWFELEEYHLGIEALIRNMRAISQWYEKRELKGE